jgi:hypothetical protein
MSLAATRIWSITPELAVAGLLMLADKGYQGVGDPRSRPAQGLAQPAQTPLLPLAAGQLAEAIHVLQAREIVR